MQVTEGFRSRFWVSQFRESHFRESRFSESQNGLQRPIGIFRVYGTSWQLREAGVFMGSSWTKMAACFTVVKKEFIGHAICSWKRSTGQFEMRLFG